jgi:hypothetical protein
MLKLHTIDIPDLVSCPRQAQAFFVIIFLLHRFASSFPLRPRFAKPAEVTVPSLADWEKDWQENPQRNTLPKSIPVDYRSSLVVVAQSN